MKDPVGQRDDRDPLIPASATTCCRPAAPGRSRPRPKGRSPLRGPRRTTGGRAPLGLGRRPRRHTRDRRRHREPVHLAPPRLPRAASPSAATSASGTQPATPSSAVARTAGQGARSGQPERVAMEREGLVATAGQRKYETSLVGCDHEEIAVGASRAHAVLPRSTRRLHRAGHGPARRGRARHASCSATCRRRVLLPGRCTARTRRRLCPRRRGTPTHWPAELERAPLHSGSGVHQRGRAIHRTTSRPRRAAHAARTRCHRATGR